MKYILSKYSRQILPVTGKIPFFNSYYKGLGAIFMLHRVDALEKTNLDPNEGMKVSPEYLDKLINDLKDEGYEIISLDRLYEILINNERAEKQIVFTLDDGYKDNYLNAYPIFKKHNVPFTIYVTSSMPEGKTMLWWYALEDLLLNTKVFKLANGKQFQCASNFDKVITFMKIREQIISFDPSEYKRKIEELFSGYDVDWQGYCLKYALSWTQIRELSSDPLVTIGGHTENHYSLKRLTDQEIKDEVQRCDRLLEKETGKRVEHFCFPFGSRNEVGKREVDILGKMGYKTATTTRSGTIQQEHVQFLNCLPRIFLTEQFKLEQLGMFRPRRVTSL